MCVSVFLSFGGKVLCIVKQRLSRGAEEQKISSWSLRELSQAPSAGREIKMRGCPLLSRWETWETSPFMTFDSGNFISPN